jgi:hypothetical protein
VDLGQVRLFEAKLVEHLRGLPSQGMTAIRESGQLADETAAKLKEEIGSFKKNHWPALAKTAAADEEKAEAATKPAPTKAAPAGKAPPEKAAP